MSFSLDPSQSINILGYTVWDEGIESANINSSNPDITRILVLNWPDIPGFLSAVGGGFDAKTSSYNAPLAYPDYPAILAKYATYLGIPIGGMTNDSNNLAAYKYGRVKLTYGRYPFDLNFTVIPQGEVRIKSRVEIDTPQSYDSNGEAQNIWDFSGGQTVAAKLNPNIRIPAGIVEVVRYNCSTTGQALLTLIGGTCNAQAFLGCQPETLYFDGITSTKQITFGGQNNWTLSFVLLYRGVGWNTLFNADAPATKNIWSKYQKITLASDGVTTRHPTGDFNQIAALIV